MSATREPSPNGDRWFRISERQLYFLEQLAEQYGAMYQAFRTDPDGVIDWVQVPDGMSYVGLREEIRLQEIPK